MSGEPKKPLTDAEFAALVEKINKVADAIHATAGRLRGVRGVIDCPACGSTGTLSWAVMHNGHARAVCGNADCRISFVE